MVGAEAMVPVTHSSAEQLAVFSNLHYARLNMLLHTLGAVMGLLGIGWCIGLNKVLQAERHSRAAVVAMVFAISSFTALTAMLIVQGSVQCGIGEQFGRANVDAQKALRVTVFQALRWVDLGLDFTWDTFIAWAMILFSAAMLRRPYFGKLWGFAGILIASLLFGLNVWYAPHPAKPDISAVSLVWFLGVSIKMLLVGRGGGASVRYSAGA